MERYTRSLLKKQSLINVTGLSKCVAVRQDEFKALQNKYRS